MATVYEIKIKTTSPWLRCKKSYIENMFEKFLKEYKDDFTLHKFENTEIEVKIIS